MRFNFDHLVYSYYTTSLLAKLEKVHGQRIQEGPLILFDTVYSYGVANILRSDEIIHACKEKKSIKVILQTGVWDTFYWSPRNILYNPIYGIALIKSIRYLKYLGCEAYIRILYVTAVPETSNTIGWNNNYSIKALSQWFQLQLKLLNYSNFDIVDAYEIIYPTITGKRHDHVCDNHYLCHLPYEDTMLQTVAGKAVLSSILHALCRIDDSHITGDENTDLNHHNNINVKEGVDYQDRREINSNNNNGPIYASQYTQMLQDHIIATGTIIRQEMNYKKNNLIEVVTAIVDDVSHHHGQYETFSQPSAVTVDSHLSSSSSLSSFQNINNSHHISSSNSMLSVNNTTAAHVLSTNTSLTNTKTLRKISPESLFLMWNGLRRYLPIDTYRCYYQYRDADIQYVNKSIFKMIPIDIPLPNMKDKHLLRTEELNIYIIDNCTKRFISSTRIKDELNYTYLGYMLPNTLMNIDLADDYDMTDISNS